VSGEFYLADALTFPCPPSSGQISGAHFAYRRDKSEEKTFSRRRMNLWGVVQKMVACASVRVSVHSSLDFNSTGDRRVLSDRVFLGYPG
jgi:hypothetical protein